MSFESDDVEADPFVGWVRDAIAKHETAGAGDGGALAELRTLAAEVDHEIAPLASSGSKKLGPGMFVRVREMDPRWLANWLTFDPDSGAEAGQRSERPGDPNAALIDNTTIGLVADYIDYGRPPSALGLLDLANFVNNLVLRDQLVVLHYPLGSRATGRDIEDEIKSAGPVETEILGSTLLWIRQLAHADARTLTERTEAAATWSTILGTGAPSSEVMFDVPFQNALTYLNALSFTSNSYERPSDNPTPLLISRLFQSVPSWSERERVAAVQATNCRSLLNLEAARHYNIPYAGGITRSPIKRLAWRRGRQGDAMLAAIDKSGLGVVNTLDQAYRQRVTAAFASSQETVILPVFLATVLSRIDNLNQFYECADELKEQAKPLRRRLVAIEQALNSSQPQDETRKLLAAFGDDSRLLLRTLGDLVPIASAVAGVVLTAATGQPQWLTAVLALLSTRDSLRRRTWERLYNRVWRRDMWFVTQLGQVSSELVAVIPKMELLWGDHFDPTSFGTRLNSLQGLGTL
jgi:hypothetical protein